MENVIDIDIYTIRWCGFYCYSLGDCAYVNSWSVLCANYIMWQLIYYRNIVHIDGMVLFILALLATYYFLSYLSIQYMYLVVIQLSTTCELLCTMPEQPGHSIKLFSACTYGSMVGCMKPWHTKAVYPLVCLRPHLHCASALVMRPPSPSMTRLIAK